MTEYKHDFQSIVDEGRYKQAVIYIVQQASRLAFRVLRENLPIDTVTVFSQDPKEYEFLNNYLRDKGKLSSFSHGPTLYVEVSELIKDNKIKLLGVREPDIARPEVGYADYPVTNYNELKSSNAENLNVEEITSGSGVSLLELKHPDFDVRGYVVSAEEHAND
jgi:hypothetical protein